MAPQRSVEDGYTLHLSGMDGHILGQVQTDACAALNLFPFEHANYNLPPSQHTLNLCFTNT